MVLLGVVALSGCLNQPGDTARIELVSSSTAKGYRLDYYRNRAYPCAVSGYQTFVVLTKLGTDPAATRPMWVKMHGGGIGYFNAAGTAVPSERWMHEESLASLMGSFDTGLMASVLGGAEEFRAVIVSMCSHDLYAGANTPDRNNPNLTPEGSPRTTNGLLATKAAVQFATGAFPTDDVFLQGGSAGSAGAIHVAWSMQLQGIAPAGVVADAGVINLGYEQGQIDQGLPCARPAEAAEVLPSRFHPDIASPANQPHLLVADGRLTVPMLHTWSQQDPNVCGGTMMACPLPDGSSPAMMSADCAHEPLRAAIDGQGPSSRSLNLRLCVDDPAKPRPATSTWSPTTRRCATRSPASLPSTCRSCTTGCVPGSPTTRSSRRAGRG